MHISTVQERDADSPLQAILDRASLVTPTAVTGVHICGPDFMAADARCMMLSFREAIKRMASKGHLFEVIITVAMPAEDVTQLAGWSGPGAHQVGVFAAGLAAHPGAPAAVPTACLVGACLDAILDGDQEDDYEERDEEIHDEFADPANGQQPSALPALGRVTAKRDKSGWQLCIDFQRGNFPHAHCKYVHGSGPQDLRYRVNQSKVAKVPVINVTPPPA